MSKVEEKRQIRRVLFIDEMMKNHFPTTQSFSKLLDRIDIDYNLDVTSSSKTVQRLIDYLRDKLCAPITFNECLQGYELIDPSWYINYYFSIGLDPDEYLGAA